MLERFGTSLKLPECSRFKEGRFKNRSDLLIDFIAHGSCLSCRFQYSLSFFSTGMSPIGVRRNKYDC